METKLDKLLFILEPREKAYFRRYIMSHHEGNQPDYLQLLDHLTGSRKKPLIHIENVSRKKNYLYELMLKSLVSYHEGSTFSIDHRNRINTFEVLHRKGILNEVPGHYGQELQGTDPYLSLDYSQWEKKSSFARGDIAGFRKAVEEEGKRLEVMNELHRLEKVYTSVFDLALRKKNYSDKTFRAKCKKLLEMDELEMNRSFLAPVSEVLYCRIKSVLYNFLGDKTESIHYAQRRIQLLENNAQLIAADPQNYINALTNAMEAFLILGKVDEYLLLEERMLKLEVRGQFLNARKEIRYTMNHFQFMLVKFEFRYLDKQVDRFQKTMEKYGDLIRMDEQLEIRFLITACYINKRDFRKANKEIHSFLSLAKTDVRQDIQSYMRLLNVFVHFSLQHTDLLDYVIRNTINYYKEREELGVLEKMILKFCKEELQGKSSSYLDQRLIQMQEAMEEIHRESNLDVFSLIRFK